MASNLDKAAALINLLGARASDVLRHLPNEQAEFLRARASEGLPKDPDFVQNLVAEATQRLAVLRQMPAQEGLGQIHDDFFGQSLEPASQMLSSDLPLPSLEPGVDVSPEVAELPAGPVIDYKEIARKLQEQRPPLMALLLSRIEPELREKLLLEISTENVEKIQNIRVENLPITDRVYDALYAAVFGELSNN